MVLEKVENGRTAHAEDRTEDVQEEGRLRDLELDFGRVFHDGAEDQPVTQSSRAVMGEMMLFNLEGDACVPVGDSILQDQGELFEIVQLFKKVQKYRFIPYSMRSYLSLPRSLAVPLTKVSDLKLAISD